MSTSNFGKQANPAGVIKKNQTDFFKTVDTKSIKGVETVSKFMECLKENVDIVNIQNVKFQKRGVKGFFESVLKQMFKLFRFITHSNVDSASHIENQKIFNLTSAFIDYTNKNGFDKKLFLQVMRTLKTNIDACSNSTIKNFIKECSKHSKDALFNESQHRQENQRADGWSDEVANESVNNREQAHRLERLQYEVLSEISNLEPDVRFEDEETLIDTSFLSALDKTLNSSSGNEKIRLNLLGKFDKFIKRNKEHNKKQELEKSSQNKKSDEKLKTTDISQESVVLESTGLKVELPKNIHQESTAPKNIQQESIVPKNIPQKSVTPSVSEESSLQDAVKKSKERYVIQNEDDESEPVKKLFKIRKPNTIKSAEKSVTAPTENQPSSTVTLSKANSLPNVSKANSAVTPNKASSVPDVGESIATATVSTVNLATTEQKYAEQQVNPDQLKLEDILKLSDSNQVNKSKSPADIKEDNLLDTECEVFTNAANSSIGEGAGITGIMYKKLKNLGLKQSFVDECASGLNQQLNLQGVQRTKNELDVSESLVIPIGLGGNIKAIANTVAPRGKVTSSVSEQFIKLYCSYWNTLLACTKKGYTTIGTGYLGAGIYGCDDELSLLSCLIANIKFNEMYGKSDPKPAEMTLYLWPNEPNKEVYNSRKKLNDRYKSMAYEDLIKAASERINTLTTEKSAKK